MSMMNIIDLHHSIILKKLIIDLKLIQDNKEVKRINYYKQLLT